MEVTWVWPFMDLKVGMCCLAFFNQHYSCIWTFRVNHAFFYPELSSVSFKPNLMLNSGGSLAGGGLASNGP